MRYYIVGLVVWDGFENECIYKSKEYLEIDDCVLVKYRGNLRVGVIINETEKPNFKCKPIEDIVLMRRY